MAEANTDPSHVNEGFDVEVELDLGSDEREHRMLSTGHFRTANGMLGEKLLREYEEPLQAYLCIRLGDPRLAAAAYDDVGLFLNSRTRRDLQQGPSLRALICRVARDVSASQIDPDVYVESERGRIPWEPPPVGSIEGYGGALDHVRESLRTIEAELLCLRHGQGHGLRLDELAYVFREEPPMLERRLETAVAWVELLVNEALPGRRLDAVSVVRDAFRIIPSSVECYSERRTGPPPKLAPGVRVGERYEIVSCIGGGQFAWVYRANDTEVPGHSVALKMLHRPARTPVTREGAMRELSLIASAFHPSLVQFKAHGWFLDRLWFVMPWYEGETLRERIDRAPLTLAEAAPLFVQLSRALAALHGAGVIHQDIKPENILLAQLKGDRGEPTGELLPVLLDLGVAAPEGEFALAGTPVYFSPEAAERIVSSEPELPLTPKADVFALALSLVHAVVGPPADGTMRSDELEDYLAKRAREGVRVRTTGRLRPIRRLLRRSLARNPRDRPSAAELAEALRERGAPRARGPVAAAACGVMMAAVAAFAGLTQAGDAGRDLGHALGAQLSSFGVAGATPVERARLELLSRRLERQEERAAQLERELSAHRDRAGSADCGVAGAESARAPSTAPLPRDL